MQWGTQNVNIFSLSKRRLKKSLFSVQKYLQSKEKVANGGSSYCYTKTQLKVEVKEIHARNKVQALARKIINTGRSHGEVRSALDVSF